LAHAVADEAPASQYEPAGHALQAVRPVVGAYVPEEHDVQVAACSVEYVPIPQTVGLMEEFKQKYPAGQILHVVLLVPEANVPGEQENGVD